MNIYLFIKTLTTEERILLASEVDLKVGYLNYLASAQKGISLRSVSAILESNANLARKPREQFTRKEYKKFRRTWLINRGLEM